MPCRTRRRRWCRCRRRPRRRPPATDPWGRIARPRPSVRTGCGGDRSGAASPREGRPATRPAGTRAEGTRAAAASAAPSVPGLPRSGPGPPRSGLRLPGQGPARRRARPWAGRSRRPPADPGPPRGPRAEARPRAVPREGARRAVGRPVPPGPAVLRRAVRTDSAAGPAEGSADRAGCRPHPVEGSAGPLGRRGSGARAAAAGRGRRHRAPTVGRRDAGQAVRHRGRAGRPRDR